MRPGAPWRSALLFGNIGSHYRTRDLFRLRLHLTEDFLKPTVTPGHGVPYAGEVHYGPQAEHCWNGDPNQPNWYSRLHYNQMYLPQIIERFQKTAPSGVDLTSWRY